MSVCIIGAGGGGVNRVERIIFPAGRTGNVKKAFFSYILLGKPACDMVSFAWKAARTAAAACETGRAVCGCGAVKGPVVPWNGEQGRIAALNFVSLVANLGILFFFKYYNFFAQSANGLLAARGFPAVPMLGVLLPVGISFYTFQANYRSNCRFAYTYPQRECCET